MNEVERAPEAVLTEAAPALALFATRDLYAEQPDLWRLGERGRARTLEDFGHHFRALQVLDEAAFRAHVQYCRDLFAARGFPQRWLDDAWRLMAAVLERELPAEVAQPAISILTAATSTSD